MLVRRVTKVGNSIAFTLPRHLEVPSTLYVYVGSFYVLYTPVGGIDAEMGARPAGLVRPTKKRYRTRSGGEGYVYVVTLPRGVARELKVRPGDEVLVACVLLYGELAILVVTSTDVVEKSIVAAVDSRRGPLLP